MLQIADEFIVVVFNVRGSAIRVAYERVEVEFECVAASLLRIPVEAMSANSTTCSSLSSSGIFARFA